MTWCRKVLPRAVGQGGAEDANTVHLCIVYSLLSFHVNNCAPTSTHPVFEGPFLNFDTHVLKI